MADGGRGRGSDPASRPRHGDSVGHVAAAAQTRAREGTGGGGGEALGAPIYPGAQAAEVGRPSNFFPSSGPRGTGGRGCASAAGRARAGTRPGTAGGGGEGGEPTAIFPRPNRPSEARGRAPLPAAARPLSRDREGLRETQGRGRQVEEAGTRAGGGLRRRVEPPEAEGAGKGAMDAACRPMTSEVGRASRQWDVPPGAGGGHWGQG